MADDALAELDQLTEQLIDLLIAHAQGRAGWSEVLELQQEIAWLTEDLAVASQILGYLSPWEPESDQRVVSLSVALPVGAQPRGRWRWPQLQKALDWLRSQALIVGEQVQQIVSNAREIVFTPGTLTDTNQITAFRGEIEQSMRAGDSLQDFRKRVKDVVSLSRAETETLFRTNTKRAFTAGQDAVLKVDAVKRVIPFVMYRSTQDGRTRGWHKALDGWIAEVDSPLHEVFKRIATEYNCRCALVPMSERRRGERPVKEVWELPQEWRAKYGV